MVVTLNLFIVKTKHDNGLDTSVSSRCLLGSWIYNCLCNQYISPL